MDVLHAWNAWILWVLNGEWGKCRLNTVTMHLNDCVFLSSDAEIKVISRAVSGDSETVFYHAEVEKTITNNADVKVDTGTKIWIISSSTKQCDCHRLKAGTTYIVGLTVQKAYGTKLLYYLAEDAVVMRQKESPRFLAKLAKCN